MSDSVQNRLWEEQFCQLPTDRYKDRYADFIKGDEPGHGEDDDVADTWRDTIILTRYDHENIENTLDYLLRDENDNGMSLAEEHDIQRFMTAQYTNDVEYTTYGGVDSHREPGIVTELTTDRADQFVSVYDPDGCVTGRWIARRAAVRGYDMESIINRFALWNNSLVNQNVASGWGDYECVAKVYVRGSYDLPIRVSYVGGFQADDYPGLDGDAVTAQYDGRLDGGVIQYEILERPSSSDWPFDSDAEWVPLGKVNELNDDTGDTLDDRWDAADPDSTASPATGECAR
ncbi:hypothetical protein [Halosimplex halobium]|uniref:hypothetical protein n=1 Tax=Halosimplex halobium TaxID=3396618 RepID=UPI003F54BA55